MNNALNEYFNAKIKELSERVNNALNEYFNAKIEEARRISVNHYEYYSKLKDFVLRGGKRLRPVSLIMAYKGIKGVIDEGVVRASLCVELLHNSSLIHDDIMDRDEYRRGEPTFHALYREWYRRVKAELNEHFGVSMGILGGDSLFNMGFEILSNAPFHPSLVIRSLNHYVEAYRELVDGMILDMMLPLLPSASEEDYMLMVSLKTGALFEKSIAIGATLAGGSELQVSKLSEYAQLAAQAFQVRDDVLGLFGGEEVGKPIGSDLREGKRTLIVIKALEGATQDDRIKLQRLLGKRDLTIQEVEEAKRIIISTGALNYAQAKALKLVEAAKQKLKEAKPPLNKEAEAFFTELTDFFIERSY
ncbi:MAG: polyprenyl synthetase family protein [Candidatus Nezhaarchaeales archaeon]